MARTIIPFGPQHPVLPEPIHLDLVVEDEKVIEARPSIGFIHRGLEKLVEKKDYVEFVYIAERICGICSFIHGQTYCQAMEAIMNVAGAAARALPADHLGGTFPAAQPPALAGADGGCGGLREPVHALLARARARAQYHRSHHRRPRHLRLVQDRRRAAGH